LVDEFRKMPKERTTIVSPQRFSGNKHRFT